MELRKSKETDQQQTKKAYELLQNFISSHTEIEPSIWAAAFWSSLVNGYISSGITYEVFTEEWNRLKLHYKPWFEE